MGDSVVTGFPSLGSSHWARLIGVFSLGLSHRDRAPGLAHVSRQRSDERIVSPLLDDVSGAEMLKWIVAITLVMWLSTPTSAQTVGGPGGRGGDAKVTVFAEPGSNLYLGAEGGAGGHGGNASSGAAVVSTETIGRCTLDIAGESVVNAYGCQYAKANGQILIVGQSVNRKYTYQTRVVVNDDMTASGYLSTVGHPGERSLGAMTGSGACWINSDQSVRVCAWR